MALFAGHIVDQNEKKRLLVKCIIGFSVISLGLFFVTLPAVTHQISQKQVLYIMYFLIFLGGIVRAFLGPTIFSLFSLLVPKHVYSNAVAWGSSIRQSGNVIGPAVGGFAIHFIGVNSAMFLIVGCSLLALIALFQISEKPILNPNIGEPLMHSLREGIKFVLRTKVILGSLTLDMFAVLFGGAMALLPIYAQDILGVGAEGFGVLRAAPAVGALLIMFTATHVPFTKNAGLKLLGAIFIFGVCIIIFGISTSFWVSIIALFLSGAVDGVSMIIRQTILQVRTPDAMRGRVASVNSIFVGSSNELGAFESGLTAKLMGTVTAVVFGGVMTIVTVVSTGFIFPVFKNLDLEEGTDIHEKLDSQ
jgi:MFS family permease